MGGIGQTQFMTQSTSSLPHIPRKLDHVVLPVSSLENARKRLNQLGFTVAPDAVHPFGTENCCVFLKDGTYLEPLGIAQRETCEAEAMAGNVFVARDQAYRFRRGVNGFSAMVFASEDAGADQAGFVNKGISAGNMLDFSRVFDDGKGKKAEASFSNAFAADLRAPDMFVFACQRVKSPDIDRSQLQNHANGVQAIREIVATETNPSDFQYFLQEVINQRNQNAHSFGLDIAAGNVNISVLNRDGFRVWFGTEIDDRERGLQLRGIIFSVVSLAELRQLFEKNSIAYQQIGERVIVDPAEGQGAWFAFEEN
jgi:hypothetical protein